jgi:hypothetical protein
MLGVVPSGANAISDTIVVLIYLAAIVTSVGILVSRIRARRRKKTRPQATPAEAMWTGLLAPMSMPGWAAPTRPPRPAARERISSPPAPASAGNGSSPTTGPPVIDLRTPSTEPASDGAAGRPPAEKSPAGDRTEVQPAPVTTLAPPKPVRDQPYVTILGPPDVFGWTQTPDRRIVTELAVYLALHRDRPRSAEELLEALWPPRENGSGKEPDVDTVHQAVSRLRRCLGPDSVPDAVTTGGYLLADSVGSDWDRFRQLVNESTAATNGQPLLQQALLLVEGQPFSGLRRDSYRWVWSEFLASKTTAAVVEAAHRLAQAALGEGDDSTADWAACRGLTASPAEELLIEDRLYAAAKVRDQARLDRVWTEARGTLGAQADDGPVGTTYRRLKDEMRGSG